MSPAIVTSLGRQGGRLHPAMNDLGGSVRLSSVGSSAPPPPTAIAFWGRVSLAVAWLALYATSLRG